MKPLRKSVASVPESRAGEFQNSRDDVKRASHLVT